jgi:hypothetical protein
MQLEPWLSFLIAALATHRMSALWANDDGPLDMMKRMRESLESWGTWYSPIKFLSDLISCVRCNSVWFGAAFGLLWSWAYGMHFLAGLVAGLAMSSITIWLDEQIP